MVGRRTGTGETPAESADGAPSRLAAMLTGERDRWVLWLPVMVGLGIGVYFGLPAEPPLWLGAAGVAVAAAAVGWVGRSRPAILIVLLGMGAVAAGFAVAQWRTVLVAAPVIAQRTGPATVSGRISAVQIMPKARRVTLERLRISRIGGESTPHAVRIRMAGRQPAMAPGDWIRVRAILAPPPPPATPGAFDFQRQSYFRRLGGVGFSVGTAEVTARATDTGWDAVRLSIARTRQAITERVLGAVEGAAGAVAAALMTGERGSIPRPVITAMRDSGLAHLLAISGLHIGLVAGFLFFGLRGLLALLAPLALRYPIKKWAAGAAIAGALAYALVAGATVPTQRAFLMIGLVLVAVLVDRRGLSMRMVAWAALVILALSPESLLGASFQLSFAAVTALIAAYEFLRARPFARPPEMPTWRRRALFYLGGVALTTLIAGTATMPFAVYHFNRIAAFGLAANLVAVPVTALWIMPWAVIAFLLMPLGWESVALVPMGWGVETVIRVAETVAAWPGAVTLVPAMPVWGLALVAGGGLWLCLWQRPWRLAGVAGIAVGLVAITVTTTPDVLVDGRGKLMAVRLASGALAVSSAKSAAFNRRIWLRRAAQTDDPTVWPRAGPNADGTLTCDWTGCVYRAGGRVVAIAKGEGALAEDCWIADALISLVPVRARCPSATVIDRFDLWRDGGHALWLEPGGTIRVESVNGARGNRPWVVRPRPRQGKNEPRPKPSTSR